MNKANAMNRKHINQLEYHCIRIEKMIYLPSVHAWPECSDEFIDMKESYPEEFKQAFNMPDNLLDEDAGIVSEWLCEHNFTGFTAMIHTPVMKPEHEGWMSFSWGSYNQTLMYADSIQELVSKAVTWAESQDEAQQ